jgi:hypothetical protein
MGGFQVFSHSAMAANDYCVVYVAVNICDCGKAAVKTAFQDDVNGLHHIRYI